jgi:hypothetical protein
MIGGVYEDLGSNSFPDMGPRFCETRGLTTPRSNSSRNVAGGVVQRLDTVVEIARAERFLSPGSEVEQSTGVTSSLTRHLSTLKDCSLFDTPESSATLRPVTRQ